MLYRWITGLSLWTLVWAGLAESASSPVQRYFQELRSLRAEFTQRVYDERERLIETSSGRVIMCRPGQFRWDYQKPNAQIIVADGKRLWNYDIGLAQVTVRRLDTALGATPLALLSGSTPLEETFTISAVQKHDGFDWYELTPRAPHPEFRLLRVGFKNRALASLELEDAFNQRTRLDLHHLEYNPPLDPELLKFVPPPGVDVVGDLE